MNTSVAEPTYEDLVGPEAVKDEELEVGAKLAAHDLFSRLQGTFSEPNYITLEEVRDATGFDRCRTADAMAVSLYRSRGKSLWGFEFKVSRTDWLKELKQPEKSESILRFCDYWALVVPNKDIVKPGELPETWGLYIAQKNRLKCITPCPKSIRNRWIVECLLLWLTLLIRNTKERTNQTWTKPETRDTNLA